MQRMLYTNEMVTQIKKKNHNRYTKKVKRKEQKYITKECQQTVRAKKKKQKRTTRTTIKNNKMAINAYLSISTLNINELNVVIKRYRLTKWIKKKSIYMCLPETHFRPKETCRWKAMEWRNIYHTNACEKKARV